jgi:ABC-type glycerol-3-phosphate transport system permease component
MMLPGQVTLIPQFVLFFKLGWVNTFRPLWLPSWLGGGAFYIFLLRQFIATLPMELDEAALIDGAGYIHIFWRIVLPLCKPVLATVCVISFISSWNDFMGPLIYLNSPEKFTVALGLRFFNIGGGIGEPGEPMGQILMAACVIALVPCVTVFFLVQRFFVRGIVLSGIKG